MHGVLANIISVPTEYETAIEMCLGASLQNIVTDTEEDAKKLVEKLRKFVFNSEDPLCVVIEQSAEILEKCTQKD